MAEARTTKDGRHELSRDRPEWRTAPPPRKRPAWHTEALQLWLAGDEDGNDLTQAQVAERLGRKLQTTQAALNSPWAKQRRRDIEARTRERLVEAGVNPVLQAQLEAPAAMGRIIQASKDATKPLEVASVNKDVLAIAGFVTDRRQSTNLNLSVSAKYKDFSDAQLEEAAASLARGIVPEKLRHVLAIAPPETE